MKHAQLLDCTLRDGAYLIDKKFGDDVIRGIIAGLVDAHVDMIEIGFFQDDDFGEGKTTFRNSADAARFVPADKGGALFTVLADYSRFDTNNLDECRPDSIDAVRECFFKKERFDAIQACRNIKAKGYKLFVQPVDILGYTDMELIDFLNRINEVEPYCLSIVDTFGSMYQEDLHRVFEIINHNLISTCKIGFHSHNNMQLSNALTQEFIRMTVGKREVVVDSTISGMGRGAGNTPTELVAQYMVSQLGYNYNMDAILDIIDGYMDNIRSRCTWGYTTPYFVAGCFSAHVNNIAYLSAKNSIRSKDIRYILNKIGAQARKRYDYDLLERTYMELLQSDHDDAHDLERIASKIAGREVLILVPGSSIVKEEEQIKQYIQQKNPCVIAINFIPSFVEADYVWLSNVKRYQVMSNMPEFKKQDRILTSNIGVNPDVQTAVVSFLKYIKCGWEHLDNSTLMLLRVLDVLKVNQVSFAGFDGYDAQRNYVSEYMELSSSAENPTHLNDEIIDMLANFNDSRECKGMTFHFVTTSRFEPFLK